MNKTDLIKTLKDLKILPDSISFYTGLDEHGDVMDMIDSHFTYCDLSGVQTQCGVCVARTTDDRWIEFTASDDLIGGHLGRLAGAF